MAAVLGKSKVMDAAQSTFISSTMWTERIGPAAALATIKKFRMLDSGKHLMSIGEAVQKGWMRSANRYDINIAVSGIPPLSHFSFQYENALAMKALFVQLMLEKGFLASNLFYAMAAHQKQHVDAYLKNVDDSFGIISEAIKSETIEKLLTGQPASPGFKRLN